MRGLGECVREASSCSDLIPIYLALFLLFAYAPFPISRPQSPITRTTRSPLMSGLPRRSSLDPQNCGHRREELENPTARNQILIADFSTHSLKMLELGCRPDAVSWKGGACTEIGMLNYADEVYRLPLRNLHGEVGTGNYFSAH